MQPVNPHGQNDRITKNQSVAVSADKDFIVKETEKRLKYKNFSIRNES